MPHSSKRGTRSAKASRKRQPLPTFLALPAEIRLLIYKLVVPNGRWIILIDTMRRLIKQNHWIVLLPSAIAFPKLRDFQALLRVHSLCHNEVALLLYGSNEFYFHDLQDGFNWLDQIGPRNTSMIRELNMCIRDFGNVRAMKDYFHRVLQPMTGLRILNLWHYLCLKCTSTPCIGFLRRARYIARHGPWLTRTYLDNILPRYTDPELDPEPDKNKKELDVEAEWDKFWAKKKRLRDAQRSTKRKRG